jgi:hypothetical protein
MSSSLNLHNSRIEVAPKSGKLVSKILTPALKFWLSLQLDSIENLQLTLTGGNRQILSGSIPGVLISASHAMYQGIHLSQIFLEGTGIRFNIGEVLQGQPLHLIDPVPVNAQLQLTQGDIDASLKSLLFNQGIQEFLEAWLHSVATAWEQLQINLDQDRLTLTGLCQPAIAPETEGKKSAVLQTGLEIRNGHQLYLVNPQLQIAGQEIIDLENFSWDFGSEVMIAGLKLLPGQLICQGQIMVTPLGRDSLVVGCLLFVVCCPSTGSGHRFAQGKVVCYLAAKNK